MRRDQYFIPFVSCIFSKGAFQGIIIDTQKHIIKIVPNTLIDFVLEAKEETISVLQNKYSDYPDIINEYADFVINEGICFVGSADQLHLFPKLSLKWDAPSEITNAIVDINIDSKFNIFTVIEQLEKLNCLHIQLRIFSLVEKKKIYQILDKTKNKSFRTIEMICDYNSFKLKKEILEIPKLYKRVSSILIYNSPPNKSQRTKEKKHYKVNFYSEKIKNNSQCGVIDPIFFNKEIEHYTESQKHNTCLNRKISIDVNGDIKNCPSMSKSYGNIKDTTLAEAIKKQGFKDIWYIHKDQIEVCKDCEFRHICTDCRAYLKDPNNIYSQPEKCNYNPYIAKWKGQEGYITVEQWKQQNNS